jgi:hypothetical protein
MRALQQSLLLCATLVALGTSPAARAGGVIDNVLTKWRSQVATCEDGKVRFPEPLMHVAMFEAINAITPKYASYLQPPTKRGAGSVDAAAAAAAHGVLVALCPYQAKAYDGALEAALEAVADEQARDAGAEIGRAAAAAVLAARADSGADARDPVFEPSEAGRYAPTMRRVGLTMASQQPWILRSADEVRPAPPPALSSEAWARDFEEIKTLGARKSTTRTPAQTDSAEFWAPRDTRSVLAQLIARPGRDLVDDARFLALAEMAHSDAYVAMMDGKYHYDLWRPITAIRHADRDGNDATTADPVWLGLGETPFHPEYPCGHCLSAAAVGAVIAAEFGPHPPPLVLTADDALLRRYDTPREYVDDVAQSRIWLGVHYRFSVDVGVAMGTAIGELAAQRHFLALDAGADAD